MPGGHEPAGLLLGLEWRQGVQNPLAADQRETVPAAAPLRWAGRNVAVAEPSGGKSWKLTMGGQPLALGCASGAVGSLQGFS